MPIIKGILLLIPVIALFSCQHSDTKKIVPADPLVTDLLKKANDNSLPLKTRLANALHADSAAILKKDLKSRITSQKTIGTLYLKIGNTKPARYYFNKMAALAAGSADIASAAVALNNIGTICNSRSDYDSALFYYQSANNFFKETGDHAALAGGLENIGIVYKNQGDLEDAFRYSSDAARILDSLKDHQNELAHAYTTLGNILKELDRPDEALQYHLLSLQIRNKLNDTTGEAGSLNNIGNIYLNKKEFQKALVYYDSSLKLKEQLGLTKSINTTVGNIATAYSGMKLYAKAEENFSKAISLSITGQDKNELIIASNGLAQLYIQENELAKAKRLAIETRKLLPASGASNLKLDNIHSLVQIYQGLNKTDSALFYANYAIELKDSIFSSDMTETIARMNVKFNTGQKEKELIHAGQLQMLQLGQIHTQQVYILLLAVMLLALSVLMILLYRSNKVIRLSNLRIKTLMNELNHRVKNNLQLILDMLNMQINISADKNQAIVIQSSISRVQSMNIIHSLLYKKGFSGSISIRTFIEALLANLSNTFHGQPVVFETAVNIADISLDIDKAIPVGLILNELITNLYKYGQPAGAKGVLEIKLQEQNNTFELEISDNCRYWNIEEMRAKKNGLGLFLVATLVQQLKATWQPVSTKKGTTHIIRFRK